MAKKARSAALALLVLLALLGLVVGFSHWQLAQQTPHGAWELDMNGISGDIRVGGNTVLVAETSGTDGWVAVRRDDGERLAGEDGIPVIRTWLAENGWFAIAAGQTSAPRLTIYDRAGREIWTKTSGDVWESQVVSLADDGAVVSDCAAEQCELRKIGADGDVVWHRALEPDESAPGARWVARSAAENDREALLTPSAPTIAIDDEVRFLDPSGVATGAAVNGDHAVLVDDLLVTAEFEDDRCLFRGMSVEGEVWASETACPGATGAPFFAAAMPERLFVGVEGGETGSLSVDPHSGETAPSPWRRSSGFDPEELTATAMSDRVIVRQDRSTFTGWSPETGKQIWEHRGPGPTEGALDAGQKNSYPGVDVSGELVSILSRAAPWWKAFALGAEVPASTVTILDGRSGAELARYRADDLYAWTATDDGVLLLSDGVLRSLSA